MRHTPVLLQQVIGGLAIKAGDIFVDCNLGDGGHSQAVLQRTRGKATIVGIDLDPEALKRAKVNLDLALEKWYGMDNLKGKLVAGEVKPSTKKSSKDYPENQSKIYYCQNNFSHIGATVREVLGGLHVIKVDAILYDLGLSSFELEESGKGFSFKNDEPLYMTFGQKDSYNFTAEDIINSWSVDQIETIIRGYGDEKFAGRIARRIVEARKVKQQLTGKGIETARELAELVRSAYPGILRFGRIHPATKTFQALRIAVNDELTALKESLPQAIELLKKGGRLAVISYHSLEDRIVKHIFRQFETEGAGRIITKRPIVPEDIETKNNPRSRSAKLRIIERV